MVLKICFLKKDETKTADPLEEKDIQDIKTTYPIHSSIAASRSGYVQIIDYETIILLAKKHDMVVNLPFKAGDYVVEKSSVYEVYAKKSYSDKVLKQLRSLIILGHKRTPIQDAEFAIHQLVEIAARALSPGINDPYTAITCIDNLTSAMCYLTVAEFPKNIRSDEEGTPRVLENPLTFAGIMDAVFNQIRQYGKEMPVILIRLMESLTTIHGFTCLESHKEVVAHHALVVLGTAESANLQPRDMADLKERYNRLGRAESSLPAGRQES